MHIPVMLEEVVKHWVKKPEGIYVDGTFGGGGHSLSLLESYPKIKIIAFDYDKQVINGVQQIPLFISSRLTLINDNFINLESNIDNLGIQKVDGFLFDLGISTEQLNDPARGFSYRLASPLDMRANSKTTLKAEDIINNYSLKDLADIFYYYGEERKARVIARKICEKRKKEKIISTEQLTSIIASCSLKKTKKHPARQVFQALRIVVNNELDNLNLVLEAAIKYLDVGGRILVISYHSLEDRITKEIFKKYGAVSSFKIVTKKPLVPSREEIKINHCSRSAKLRILERIK